MGHEYVKENETFNTSRNGVVPKPTQADVSAGKVLKADGTWGEGGGGGTGDVEDVYVNGESVVDDEDKIAKITSYKEVTQNEYTALPASKTSDGVLYCIKDAPSGIEGFPPLIYSDEEREVGVWRDGKPIYEKTVHFTKTDCTKENDYDYRLDFNRTALSIKDVIDIKGILKMLITNWGTIEIKFNGRAYCLNDSTKDRWVDWTNYYQSSAIKSQKTSEGYGFNLNSETSNWDGYYTIQYTKTTDV